jgi:hypothetical protein
VIGIDFDNTIVCYDGLFQRSAVERGLVSDGTARTKEQLRDVLRAHQREDEWTALQGHVYGPGMEDAEPFDGALDFLSRCVHAGVPVAIVSHRTPVPYAGPPHDLHAFARAWLDTRGITVQAHFEDTREAKLERIRALGCSHFVDDLPEFLTDPAFPSGVARFVFDPYDSEAAAACGLPRIASWPEAAGVLGVP